MVDDAITRDVEPLLAQLPFVDGDVERIDALPRSFESFFAETRDPMLRRASLLTGSASQAEEAVQESFVRVYERWSSIDDPGAYLRRAVVNRCTSWHRHRAVVRRTDADVARAESYLDQPAETDELAAALAKLSGRRRAVVVLRRRSGPRCRSHPYRGDDVLWQYVVDGVAAFPLSDRRPTDEYVALDASGQEVLRTTWSTVSLQGEGTPVTQEGRQPGVIQTWSSTFVTAQPDYIPDVDATVLEGMTQARAPGTPASCRPTQR
jgi:hypothetical protein